jgi:hypothetical protein
MTVKPICWTVLLLTTLLAGCVGSNQPVDGGSNNLGEAGEWHRRLSEDWLPMAEHAYQLTEACARDYLAPDYESAKSSCDDAVSEASDVARYLILSSALGGFSPPPLTYRQLHSAADTAMSDMVQVGDDWTRAALGQTDYRNDEWWQENDPGWHESGQEAYGRLKGSWPAFTRQVPK